MGLAFAGLSQETGGGRGPSPGTGTTNLQGPSHDQGGTDIVSVLCPNIYLTV